MGLASASPGQWPRCKPSDTHRHYGITGAPLNSARSPHHECTVCLHSVIDFRRQSLMSRYQSGNMAGEIWVQWFSCCINQPAAQQVSHHVGQN
jgi:hypothetical protein